VVAGGAGLTYLHPLLLVFLIIAGWGLAGRRRKLLAAGLLGVFLVAWPPAAWLAARPLEVWYPAQAPWTEDAGAIVVLAAGILKDKPGQPGPTPKQDTYMRCRYGAWLWKRSGKLPILLCGGAVPHPPAAAVVMRQMMIEQGVPESMLWTEESSNSTYENAKLGTQILRAKGIRKIVLVTEGYHMLRSERCFRRQGVEVIAAPCNFTQLEGGPNTWVPGGEAVITNEQTLHEMIGLGWYLLRGRI
jgi:uncharacterized SAM-binding protein YcdF (DUF218 family)